MAWGGLGFVGLSDPVSKGKAAVVAISRSRDPSTITAERKNYDDAKKLYDSQLSKVTVGGLVYALAWAFGVGDAAFGSPPAAPGLSVRVVPDITTAYGMSGRLGFTIPIGSNRH